MLQIHLCLPPTPDNLSKKFLTFRRSSDNAVIFHTYHKSQANDPDPLSSDRSLCGPVSCIITSCHLYGKEQSLAL